MYLVTNHILYFVNQSVIRGSDLYVANQSVAQKWQNLRKQLQPPDDRMTTWEKGTEREREGECEGVLGEDKHSWGSQLLNNSERETHSTQYRGGALSGQLIHCRGEVEEETGEDCSELGREEEWIKIAWERKTWLWERLPVRACMRSFVCCFVPAAYVYSPFCVPWWK